MATENHQERSDTPVDLLDLICDEFDQKWADSQQPCVAEHLNRSTPSKRARLLEMLISIDVEYRIRHQQEFDKGDYDRFGPDAAELAAQAYESANASIGPMTDSNWLPEINGYRMLRRIGEGGMGAVYLAEQDKPVRRRVAVKVVKAGYNSAEVITRFEAERQALALMEHPHIAKVLDAGVTDRGAPYFTMEWVQGVPITQYCRENRLSANQRIDLFLHVCQAVQHAHQKGIIHRDLKPSNILVALNDGVPVPKVIDFGLAKALKEQVRLTDKTIFTNFGTIVGSPQYMSPEQAELNQVDVDTRSDVYSLGAILYELLTGTTPLEPEAVRHNSPLSVLEIIRENDPPRPSVRLESLSGDNRQKMRPSRNPGTAKLQQMLRSELDWIVMKALDRDRQRRYETVEAFRDDLRRFLDDEPVKARPPSSWYAFRKTAQKYKALLTTAAIFFVLLSTTTMIIARLYVNEKTARSATEQNNARARYFSATGFWARNRTREAVDVLHEIDPQFRFIEWRLARQQFEKNCVTFGTPLETSLLAATPGPDERWIATVDTNNSIAIWDIASGQIARRFDALDDGVRTISFHPNGQLLATGGDDGKVRLWNFGSGKQMSWFDNAGGPVLDVKFSHDGSRIAAAGGPSPFSPRKHGDNQIRIWNINDPDDVVVLNGHTSRVNSIAFSPDDSRIVSGSRDKTIRIWDLGAVTHVRQFGATSYVLSVAFSPCGNFIASGSADNQLALWHSNRDENAPLWRRDAHGFEGDTVDCVAFSPDGQKLASGSFDRTVKIWDVRSGNQVKILRGHFGTVLDTVFFKDSRRLLSASLDGTAKLWNLELKSESKILKGHTQPVNAISFSPDSRLLASASGKNRHDPEPSSKSEARPADNSVRVWNLDLETSQCFTGHTGPVTDVEFSPASHAGDWFASSSTDGTIRFWRPDDPQSQSVIVAHDGQAINGIAWHPDGNQLASAGSDNLLRIRDVAAQTETSILKGHESPVLYLAWSNDGTMIASADQGGTIIVWNANGGGILWKNTVTNVNCLAFSPDSLHLASGQGDLAIWDARTGQLLKSLSHSRLGHYFTAYYASSKVPRLLTGGRQGQVWLWDSETWEELHELNVASAERWNFIYDGKFSPDGSLIATANRDGTIRLWLSPFLDDLDN